MTVDVHAVTLKAMLLGDEEGFERGREQIQGEGSDEKFRLILLAAFTCGARRRLGPAPTRGDVTLFVADARVRGGLRDLPVDVKVVERLLRGALGERSALEGLTEQDTLVMGPLLGCLVSEDYPPPESDIDSLILEAQVELTQPGWQAAH